MMLICVCWCLAVRRTGGRTNVTKTGIFAIKMISQSHWLTAPILKRMGVCVCVCNRTFAYLFVIYILIFWYFCALCSLALFFVSFRWFLIVRINLVVGLVFFFLSLLFPYSRLCHRISGNLSLKVCFFFFRYGLCLACFMFLLCVFVVAVVVFCCQYQGQCDCTQISAHFIAGHISQQQPMNPVQHNDVIYFVRLFVVNIFVTH